MKSLLALLAGILLCAAPVWAAPKPCEELKAEIEAKLKENKVAAYTLEVVKADEVKGQKVVGSCEAGTKKIVYTRK